jgi:transcriptional regulator with XRE-family HTH domain
LAVDRYIHFVAILFIFYNFETKVLSQSCIFFTTLRQLICRKLVIFLHFCDNKLSPDMQLLLTIRQKLGISQEYLAILLNIKRAQLEKAEKGFRHLPAPALMKLLQLHEALATVPVQPAKPAKSLRMPPKLPGMLDKLQQWSAAQSTYYQALAELIRVKQQQAQNCLAVLPQLEADCPTGEETSAALVLRIVKAESERQLKTYPLELAGRCEKIAMLLEQLATATEADIPV